MIDIYIHIYIYRLTAYLCLGDVVVGRGALVGFDCFGSRLGPLDLGAVY